MKGYGSEFPPSSNGSFVAPIRYFSWLVNKYQNFLAFFNKVMASTTMAQNLCVTSRNPGVHRVNSKEFIIL